MNRLVRSPRAEHNGMNPWEQIGLNNIDNTSFDNASYSCHGYIHNH